MENGKNYFSFSELVTTDTGLPNNPTAPSHLVNLANLWCYLNSLREKLGKPIIVNSAFRTRQVNEQIGGSKCSHHMEGLACDIKTSPLYMDELYNILQQDARKGILKEVVLYSSFFHLSL